MIRLTRLNRAPIVLNSDLIEHIDVTPDTVITLTTGQILRVRETAEQVIDRIVGFRRRIFAADREAPASWADAGEFEDAGAPVEETDEVCGPDPDMPESA